MNRSLLGTRCPDCVSKMRKVNNGNIIYFDCLDCQSEKDFLVFDTEKSEHSLYAERVMTVMKETRILTRMSLGIKEIIVNDDIKSCTITMDLQLDEDVRKFITVCEGLEESCDLRPQRVVGPYLFFKLLRFTYDVTGTYQNTFIMNNLGLTHIAYPKDTDDTCSIIFLYCGSFINVKRDTNDDFKKKCEDLAIQAIYGIEIEKEELIKDIMNHENTASLSN